MCIELDITVGLNVLKFCFLGTSLCRHGMHMFDRCFGSAASHPSTPPQSQVSAADVRQKSCIVSAPFVNLARPLQPIYAMSSLIIVGYWFLCESNDLSAAGGTVSEWCSAWRPDCHVVCPVDDFHMKVTSRPSSSLCCWYYEGERPAGRM